VAAAALAYVAGSLAGLLTLWRWLLAKAVNNSSAIAGRPM
jgi:hypothetical protein